MSVIAKMHVSAATEESYGRQVHLHCVYDTELAKEENEDARFTKATPWGECKVCVKNTALTFDPGNSFFLLFEPIDEPASFEGAIAAVKVTCHSVTSFSGTSRHVELHGAWRAKDQDDGIPGPLRLDETTVGINIKMAIDNPGASLQFEPGQHYWLTFHPADKSMEEMLSMARAAR